MNFFIIEDSIGNEELISFCLIIKVNIVRTLLKAACWTPGFIVRPANDNYWPI